jgi:hypothetical protein
MKKPGTLIASLTVMAVGTAGLGFGFHMFLSGAAVEAQGGSSGPMGTGVVLALAGLFLLMAPPVTWFAKALAGGFARERAWKATLTPQERAAVNAAEVAALAAGAIAAHEAVRRQGERVRERYDATDAAAARSLASVGGVAGQPEGTGSPGQPGQVTELTPRWYQPPGD